jgi:hypothetical protein
VAQKVPEGLGSQISMTFVTWRWWGHHHHAPAALTPGNVTGIHFHKGLSRPQGHGAVGRRCHWKIQWNHRESIPGPSD